MGDTLQCLEFDVGRGGVVVVIRGRGSLRLVIRVDVRHEGVTRAVDPLADGTAVLLVARCVLVCDVPLQARLRAEHLPASHAREHFP